MRSADVIVPFIQSYVEAHAWTPWGKVEVRAAQLGNHAALFGAAPLLAENP
jgi:glucokinase